MASQSAVYCTLLLSDHYLPGAMVLAHSLRDNDAKAKLVVLYTPSNLQTATVNELMTVYDELIPVDPIINGTPANLWLMDRPDLISTFTKIELWRQIQFSRIVYIDCDVVALRSPDELLSLDTEFAAAPDVGWPDCFNSGVMVLRPNLQDYNALRTLAERGTSFDGADQGLLNGYFRDWHRLSFTYNCTPNANYQYVPAYNHFQSTIKLIHFIGAEKPWSMPRHAGPVDSPYNQLLGRWWAVYDRHYRPIDVSVQQENRSVTLLGDAVCRTEETAAVQAAEPSPTSNSWLESSHKRRGSAQQLKYRADSPHRGYSSIPDEDQLLHRSEYGPDKLLKPQFNLSDEPHDTHHTSEPGASDFLEQAYSDTKPTLYPRANSHGHTSMQESILSVVPQYVRGEGHVSIHVPYERKMPIQRTERQHWRRDSVRGDDPSKSYGRHELYVEHFQKRSEPEKRAVSEPEVQTYELPKAEWDASREPPPVNTKPEGVGLQRQTYSMSNDTHLFQPPSSYPEAPKNMYYQVPTSKPEPKRLTQVFPWENRAPAPTRVFVDDRRSLIRAHGKYSVTPVAEEPVLSEALHNLPEKKPVETWGSYSRSNVWDEVPEIRKYMEGIQKPRKAKVQVISGTTVAHQGKSPQAASDQGTSVELTSLPSGMERLSLPVTPAPIRKAPVWNRGEQSATSELPAAKGVPSQEDWNPLARLEELRRRYYEVLESPGY